MEMSYLLAPIIGYFFGSIPFGFLVARHYGVNILEQGSGNIGATNVSRVLGKKPGLLVFFLDLAKGAVGVVGSASLTGMISSTAAGSGDVVAICGLLGGVGAILGHNFTFWLKFRGGKGIATTAGVLLGLTPWTFLILITTWGILFKLTRYVSLASISAAAIMPFVTWFIESGNIPLTAATGVLGLLAILRHRSNIRRLLNGTENRFQKKRSEPGSMKDQGSVPNHDDKEN